MAKFSEETWNDIYLQLHRDRAELVARLHCCEKAIAALDVLTKAEFGDGWRGTLRSLGAAVVISVRSRERASMIDEVVRDVQVMGAASGSRCY